MSALTIADVRWTRVVRRESVIRTKRPSLTRREAPKQIGRLGACPLANRSAAASKGRAAAPMTRGWEHGVLTPLVGGTMQGVAFHATGRASRCLSGAASDEAGESLSANVRDTASSVPGYRSHLPVSDRCSSPAVRRTSARTVRPHPGWSGRSEKRRKFWRGIAFPPWHAPRRARIPTMRLAVSRAQARDHCCRRTKTQLETAMNMSIGEAETMTVRAPSMRAKVVLVHSVISAATLIGCSANTEPTDDPRVATSRSALNVNPSLVHIPTPICALGVNCHAPPPSPPSYVTSCTQAIDLAESYDVPYLPGGASALGTAIQGIQYYTTHAGVPVCYQAYTNGSIEWSQATSAHVIYGPMYFYWLNLGAEESSLGMPTVDSSISVTVMQNGDLTWTSAYGVHTVVPPVLEVWTAESCLGLPTAEWSSAAAAQTFAHGTIHYVPGGTAWTGGCHGADREMCYADGTCDGTDVCHYDGLCGQPTTCGELNQGVCPVLKCDDELHWNGDVFNEICVPNNFVVVDGAQVGQPCGYGDQPCCPGSMDDAPGQCNSGYVCNSVLAEESEPGFSDTQTCVVPPPGWTACGEIGQRCCPGPRPLADGCAANAACAGGSCVACGAPGGPCCQPGSGMAACNGPSPSSGGGFCSNGSCTPCGGEGEVCCPGNTQCAGVLVCGSGVCTEQGSTPPTCNGAAPSASAQTFQVGLRSPNGCGTTVPEYANSYQDAAACATSNSPGSTVATGSLICEEVTIGSGCDADGTNCESSTTGQVFVFDESDTVTCGEYEECSNCSITAAGECP